MLKETVFSKITKVLFCILLFGVTACGIYTYGEAGTDNSSGFSYEKVLILSPFIIYENAYNEQRYEYVDPKVSDLVSSISLEESKKAFTNAGLKSVYQESLGNSENQAGGAAFLLQTHSEDLVKKWKDKSVYAEKFAIIAKETGCAAAFVQLVKVKVGQGGSWDFVFSGAVIPGTNTTTAKGVLINLATHKIDWENSSIEREQPGKGVIKRVFKSLFSNFPGNKKKGG